jgi:hypothetical protein
MDAIENEIFLEHKAKRLVAEVYAGRKIKGARPLMVDSEAELTGYRRIAFHFLRSFAGSGGGLKVDMGWSGGR